MGGRSAGLRELFEHQLCRIVELVELRQGQGRFEVSHLLRVNIYLAFLILVLNFAYLDCVRQRVFKFRLLWS